MVTQSAVRNHAARIAIMKRLDINWPAIRWDIREIGIAGAAEKWSVCRSSIYAVERRNR